MEVGDLVLEIAVDRDDMDDVVGVDDILGIGLVSEVRHDFKDRLI